MDNTVLQKTVQQEFGPAVLLPHRDILGRGPLTA